jgi:hypothetical protein
LRAHLSAALVGALGLAPSGGAADNPAARAGAGEARPALLVAPLIELGVGWVLPDGIAFGADAGLRVAPLTARLSYRVETIGDDYLAYASGRLGWIFAEGRWLAGHAGLGAGRLVRGYAEGPPTRASGTAASGELGLLFLPGWGGGPALALQLEVLVPLSRAPASRGGALAAPAFSVVASVNVLALLVARSH